MGTPLNTNVADDGILEALLALDGQAIAALQASSADAAGQLREMMACAQRFAEQEESRAS